jgi:Ser/Thr protein kinase RdoA (MazF antagonist)
MTGGTLPMTETLLKEKGIKELKKLGGFHNVIYEGLYQDTPIIIRKSTRRTLSAIEEEVRILNTIGDDVHTIRPVKVGGAFVREHEDGVYAFFKKSDGLNWHETTLTDTTHYNAGKTLGLLHKAFQKMDRKKRASYDAHPDLKLIKSSIPFHKEETRKLLKTIASWDKPKNEYGLIHGDYLFGNLLYHGEDVTVIDFDDLEYGFYLYDVAVYLFYLLLGGNPKDIHKEPNIKVFKHFIKGYRSVNKQTNLDFDKLNTLFRLRQLKLLGTITKTMDASKHGGWQKAYIEMTNHQLEKDEPFVDIPYQSIYESLNNNED